MFEKKQTGSFEEKFMDYWKLKKFALATVASYFLRDEVRIKEFIQKIPFRDFSLKTKDGKKCDIFPWKLFPNLNENNFFGFLPEIKELSIGIPKNYKIGNTLLDAPIWDYEVFVGISDTADDGKVGFILGYLSKESLTPERYLETKSKPSTDNPMHDLTAWQFKISDLKPFSGIEHLMTLEIINPPQS